MTTMPTDPDPLQAAQTRIAELERCRAELAEDNAMLRETMKQAGLAAFFKGGGQPVDVGEHLRRVLASYTDRIAELEARIGLLDAVEQAVSSQLGVWNTDAGDWDDGASDEERDYGKVLVDRQDLQELLDCVACVLRAADDAGLHPPLREPPSAASPVGCGEFPRRCHE